MIKILAVGKVKEPFYRQGIEEYAKRISKFAKLSAEEIKDTNKENEGKKILQIAYNSYLIALDAEGKQFSSEGLAELLKGIEQKNICFAIGSQEGLSEEVLKKADLVLSLSNMTFLHEMARLILVEQIYRAMTINKGMKYHK